MSAVEDFIAERGVFPWVWREFDQGSDEAPAKELYAAYKATMQEQERQVLSPQAFSQALRKAGYEVHKGPDGNHYYSGITVESRVERARLGVEDQLHFQAAFPLVDAALADHKERMHPGASEPCTHSMPKDVLARIQDEARETVSARVADGTVDRLIERWYGAYLRWRPGDDHPITTKRRERMARVQARLEVAQTTEEQRLLSDRLERLQEQERDEVDLSAAIERDWAALTGW